MPTDTLDSQYRDETWKGHNSEDQLEHIVKLLVKIQNMLN